MPPKSPAARAPAATSTSTSTSMSTSFTHSKTYHDIDPSEIIHIRTELLKWYNAKRRYFPWRGDEPPYGDAGVPSAPALPPAKARRKRNDTADAAVGQLDMAEATNGAEQTVQLLSQRVQKPPNPYHVWVSEIMAQQTRVETVIDYFLKWIDRFPDVTTLANASADDVNSMWAGLGYYRRARYLHEGAQYVMSKLGGNLPDTLEGLREIPGVGPYTASAIGSIVYKLCTPVVDGNVIRVISRLRAIDAPSKSNELNSTCWRLCTPLVDPKMPGDFNQSMMELGATVCTPKNPKCGECPVKEYCLAFQESSSHTRPISKPSQTDIEIDIEDLTEDQPTKRIAKNSRKRPNARSNAIGEEFQNDTCLLCDTNRTQAPMFVTEFPGANEKKQSPVEHIAVCVVSRTSSSETDLGVEYLLFRRPESGLLANQWEFPSVPIPEDYTSKVAKSAVDNFLIEELSNDWQAPYKVNKRVQLGDIKHVFSHRVHEMHVESFELSFIDKASRIGDVKVSLNGKKHAWLNETDMANFGITTGVKKVLALLHETISKEKSPALSKKRKTSKQPKIEGLQPLYRFFQKK